MLSRLGTRQCLAGLMFIAIGAFAAWQASAYALGTARMMGPGFFPLCIAVLLVFTGAIAVVQGVTVTTEDRVERVALRSLFFLTAGVVAFGLLVERAGLVAAIAGLILLSCHERLRRKYLEVAVIFLVLSILTVGLFVYALGLPLHAF